MFPPTIAQIQIIAADIREEIKQRQSFSRWCGGTIPSNIENYFADVDPQGNFRKIYYRDGKRREFFLIE